MNGRPWTRTAAGATSCKRAPSSAAQGPQGGRTRLDVLPDELEQLLEDHLGLLRAGGPPSSGTAPQPPQAAAAHRQPAGPRTLAGAAREC